jgi:hypothetical protein
MRLAYSAVALTACCLVLSSCVSPAVDASGYRDKVSHSAQKMAGIIGSAQLAAQLDLDGRMIATMTDSVVSDAEQDAQSVVNSLDAVQPPDVKSIQLRDAADQVLQDASSELSDLRIYVRRHDHPNMQMTFDELTKTLADVQKLQGST